jgi:hypothetical protein
MPSPFARDLRALHNLIEQADLTLGTVPSSHPSVTTARETLASALALSE